MRKLATLLLAITVYVLMGIGGTAAADDKSKKMEKPDSIVTCQGLGAGGPGAGFFSIWVTVPIPVKLDACLSDGTLIPACSPCVRSLEEQGCKVLDATVTSFPPDIGRGAGSGGPELTDPRASFLLSCAKP